MGHWRTRLMVGLTGLLGLAMLTVTGAFIWLLSQVPGKEVRTVAIDGLAAPVEILTDSNALAHVYAETMDDAYFALGMLHARHRLWQMEAQRRVAQGRVSELLGAATLPLDRRMRALGLYRSAQTSLAALDPEVMRALRRYADGVNRYLNKPLEALPLEFQILGHKPEPWRPADSIAWFKIMALQLSTNYGSELLRALLYRRLGDEAIEDLFPAVNENDPVTLDDQTWSTVTLPFRERDPVTEPTRRGCGKATLNPVDEVLPNSPPQPVRASNAWVVGGHLTDTGAPILANDPHLRLQAPILWYLVRISTPKLSLAGATVPGVPFHLLGHNGDIAWGMTTTGTDLQDLFCEAVDPTSPDRYQGPNGRLSFETRAETIRIRNAEPETLTVRHTRHGPVLSDVDTGARHIAGRKHVLALRFTGLDPADTTAAAIYRLNRARNWNQTIDALSAVVAPQQNLLYADLSGNIGFAALAWIPQRPAASGLVPVAGADGEHDWAGFVDRDELPQALNPDSSWFANANNAIVSSRYPHMLSVEWDPPYRAQRLIALLEEYTRDGRRYSLKDAETMQADTLSGAALALLPHLLSTQPNDARARQALNLLRGWNGHMDRDRPEPLIFSLWLRRLNQALYADELGDAFPWYRGHRPRTVIHMLTQARDWCDDVSSPTINEQCEHVLSTSLSQALSEGAALFGDNPALWQWGQAHRATLAHPLISRIPVLSTLLDISVESDGGNFTLNRGASYGGSVDDADPTAPLTHTHGAGFRAIYDLSDLGNSRYMIATGQSGNPLSGHYSDLVEPWREGRYVTLSGERKNLQATATRILRLQPAPSDSNQR